MPRIRFFLSASVLSLTFFVLLTSTAWGQRALGKTSFPSKSAGSAQAGPQPLFLPPVTYGCPPGPFAVADVNGDGELDVVSTGHGTPCVLLGKGDGTFQPPSDCCTPLGGNSLALADVNGDGKPDLIVISNSVTSLNYLPGVSVSLGNGDGTFQPPMSFAVSGTDPLSVAVADLNGDGKPDIVGTTYFGGISVLMGNGDGTFQPAVVYSPGGESLVSVVIADVNGDGIPDLLAADTCGMSYNCYPDPSGTVSVLLGNGDGTFQGAEIYSSGGDGSFYNEAWPLAFGDLINAAIPALAVVNSGSGTVAVLLDNGNGTLQPAIAYSTGGAFPVSVAISDLNGDELPDLAVMNSCTRVVNGSYCSGDPLLGVLQGNGDGTFQPVLAYDLGGYVLSNPAAGLFIADLNHDGKPDVITGFNGISVLINDTGAPPPTITVTSSPNPSIFSQPVTLTATLTSSVTPPTGTVNFFVDSVQVGSATITNGTASVTVQLAAGSHSVTAVYAGSGSLYGNTSSPSHQSVKMASTAVSVTSSVDPSARSKPITYIATVTSQFGGLTTGSVVFTSGSQVLGTASVYNSGSLNTTSFATDGSYPIVATYSGDVNNSGNVSPPLIEYIDSVTTTTTITTSGSPVLVGQPVTFTASVTPQRGVVPDGEIVSFYYHVTTLLGTAATLGGKAVLTTSSIPAGSWTVKATYPGDPTYLPSLGTVKQTVQAYSTTTGLSSDPNPSAHKQSVTFTATVNSTGPQAPTGSVIFNDGTISIGKAILNNGVAILVKSNLLTGSHSITASYGGDSQSAKSTSAVLDQVVN